VFGSSGQPNHLPGEAKFSMLYFLNQRGPRDRAFQRMKMRAWQRAVHRDASLVHGKSARLKGKRQREVEIPAASPTREQISGTS
jgi:hypothetical protein